MIQLFFWVLLPSREKDSAVPYNFDMALSDTGDRDEAEKHLRKAMGNQPLPSQCQGSPGGYPFPEAAVEAGHHYFAGGREGRACRSPRPSQSGCVPPGIGQESSREDALPSQGDSTPARSPAVLDEPWPSLGFAKRGR